MKDIVNLLTEKEKIHLDYLSKTLDFGADELNRQVQSDDLNYLQNFLLYSFVPVHNFSESIFLLCKDSRPHTAQVLLRSIYEAYMTIEYIKNADTDKRLALFAKDSFRTRKGHICELESLVKRYPHLENSTPVLEKTNIASLRKFVEDHLSGFKSANGLDGEDLPKFIEMIKQMDKESVGDKKGRHELSYNIMYRQLSQYTHLSSWGLELFASQGPDTITYSLGQEKEVDYIVGQTFLYYFDLLDGLYKHKVLQGEIPKIYRDWFNEVKAEI